MRNRYNFKIKSLPPPGRKKVSDWQGMRVRTLQPMRNGMMVLPAGTLATVERATGGVGLELTGEACACCGVQISITKVRTSDVEVASHTGHEHPPVGLESRPLLVSGMLARGGRGWMMLIDSEQTDPEKARSIWHETLHLLHEAAGAEHDEGKIERMARALADACPEIVSLLQRAEHVQGAAPQAPAGVQS